MSGQALWFSLVTVLSYIIIGSLLSARGSDLSRSKGLRTLLSEHLFSHTIASTLSVLPILSVAWAIAALERNAVLLGPCHGSWFQIGDLRFLSGLIYSILAFSSLPMAIISFLLRLSIKNLFITQATLFLILLLVKTHCFFVDFDAQRNRWKGRSYIHKSECCSATSFFKFYEDLKRSESK